MSVISRRNFLFVSSGAAAGSFIVSGAAKAEGKQRPFPSGLKSGQKMPLRHKLIPGFLSEAQVTPHYMAHYGGALRGYLSADRRLQTHLSPGSAIDGAAHGALQRARTSKGNSVLLHELYFNGLALRSTLSALEVTKAIEQRFGSLDHWATDFQACAKAAAGWAMLAFHPVNGNLYNVISDEHADGVLWMATPLVVIDVYEHAFYVDYQNRKGDYISSFMNHIDWHQVNQRYENAI